MIFNVASAFISIGYDGNFKTASLARNGVAIRRSATQIENENVNDSQIKSGT